MSSPCIVVPLAQNQTNSANITPPWFVQKAEYRPLPASLKILVNGETAFGEIHRAIERAKHSVCIICWGFQPSMHFIRDGASPAIGKLLERVGKRAQVRVLSYVVDPLWLGINVTGGVAGEANVPGRRAVALSDQPATSTDAQYAYDQEWYLRYDTDQKVADWAVKSAKGMDDTVQANIRFVGRGFSAADRKAIAARDHEDKGLSKKAKATLASAPSHHQKMVLVDYEDPENAVGFLMGHNMLDEYWDTSAHSCHPYAANRGRNGKRPRQDFSSKLTGPAMGDLFRNFAQAWAKETGETLAPPAFEKYPVRCEGGAPSVCQVLRTQPQYGREDIKKAYLQAVNNATRYIYIENQYFRWPPLAEKIRAAALAQSRGGRDPGTHGSLYLFVITNADDEGMGSGVTNTYRMLDSLGRADTIPAVARAEEEDLREQNLELAKKRQAGLEDKVNASARRQWGHFGDDHMKLLQEANTARDATVAAEKERDATRDAVRRAKKSGKERTVLPQDRPGLKVHVCTLVAPDTPDGKPWTDVYIHAKLMLIDDTFLTLGSANINTRSMEVDSELNLVQDRPEITRPLRQQLWGLHTKETGAEDMSALKEVYKKWKDIMKKNKDNRSNRITPIASLTEFYRGSPDVSDLD
jgi:phosphatidylserine/phosphatidylglycerophosphate/cardiolipin synthase-like enzyme